MRIQRHTTAYRYRRSRQRSGCLPFTLVSGLLIAGLVLSWGWISERLLNAPQPTTQRDLSAARQAFERGDLEAAADQAREVYEANPERVDALILLVRALVYHSYSDYDTSILREIALQTTLTAFRQQPANPDVLAIHGFALQANSQSMDGYRMAERALKVAPQHVLARIVSGLSYGGVGGYDNALREQQAVTGQGADPWQVDAWRALAISYSDLGRYDEAGATVEKAIALNPHLPVLYFEQALYALQTGDTSAATEAYFEIMATDVDNIKARLRMCELSSMMRERETALHYCTQVTELAPTWVDGWHKLGREYFLQGNFAAAQQNLNRCSSLQVMQNVAVSDRRFECWYLQGQAAEILGDCPALLATYNEFRAMTAEYASPQTWVYPPEGPPGCAATTTPGS
jgi:tetratricopeptide (TPR) repeat protein